MARNRETKIELTAYDDLFQTDESRAEAALSKIRDIPLSEIDEFPDHPFKVLMDEDMEQLVESIKRNGVMTPATVRLKENGRYELISGHRRKKACELAGLETLKCEVKDLIRNEDATHIMYLVTKSLKYNRDKIINNLTAVIQSIIAMDTTGTDVLKLQEQIKKIEGKRTNLIDLYMSNLINKDEFTATRASCDAEIEELQSIIESVDKQREMIEQQQQLLKEIEDAIKEIVSGVEYEDEFYKHILDKMVVQDKDNIDVYLNLLPMKWSYTVAKASKKAVASEWNISEASLPMSVSRAFSSG